MSAIVDYAYYSGTYLGNIIPEESFPRSEARAEEDLDRLTLGRLAEIEGSVDYTTAIKKAICAIAEISYQIDAYASGDKKAVKTESAGGESITYFEASGTVAAALGSVKAQDELKFEAARKYLYNTGLLYWGL